MDKSTSNYGGLGFDSKDLHDAQVTGVPVPGAIYPLLASRGTCTYTQQTLTYIK